MENHTVLVPPGAWSGYNERQSAEYLEDKSVANTWSTFGEDADDSTGRGTGPVGAARDSVWFQDFKAPAWQSGGQWGSTKNAFDNEFNQKFMSIADRYANEGRALDMYSDRNFTGLVTRDDDRSGKKFGEVWQDGKLEFNIFDSRRSGFTEDEAYQIVAQYTLDGETQKRAFERGNLKEVVDRTRLESESDARKGISRQAFDRQVDKRQKELFDNEFFQGDAWGDEALVAGGGVMGAAAGLGVAAGVAGATGVGIPLAVVLGSAGLALGAIGAWMNRDLLTEQVARASLMTEMANARKPGAGIAVAAQQYGGLAMQGLMPLSNIVQGTYDATQGTIGDNEAEWYAVDPVTGENYRGFGWDLANFAGGVVGGLGMGAGLGRSIYGATLIPAVGGHGASLLYQGEVFNERSGEFQSIYTDEQGNFAPDRASAAWAAFGIDAVQSVGLYALGGAAAGRGAQIRAAEGKAPTRFQSVVERMGLKPRADRDLAGGFRFKIDPTTGRAVGDFSMLKNMHYTFLAPSEAFRGITAAGLMRLKKNAAMSADDIYQYIKRIETRAGAGWGTTLVTAYAEGIEEGTQTLLEQIATGSDVDIDDIVTSAVQGAAVGAGFGIAAARNYGTTDQRMFLNARVKRMARTRDDEGKLIESALPELTKAEWDKMTDAEKRTASSLNSVEKLAMDEAVRNVKLRHAVSQVTEDPTIVDKYKAAQLAIVESIHKKAAPATKSYMTILAQSDASVSSSRVEASLRRTSIMLQDQQQALALLQENGAPDQSFDEDIIALAGDAHTELSALMRFIRQQERAFLIAESRDDQIRILEEVNAVLGLWGESQPVPQDVQVPAEFLDQGNERQRLARAYAVSLNLARDPIDQQGSIPLLVPYASRLYTFQGADQSLGVPVEYLKAIGGDFDGDAMRSVQRLVRSENQFRLSRAGTGLTMLKRDEFDENGKPITGTGGIASAVGTMNYEEARLAKFREIDALPQYNHLTLRTRMEINRAVLRMAPTPEARRALRKHLADLFQEMSTGEPEAIENFVSSVIRDTPLYNELLQQALQTLKPIPAELHRIVSHSLELLTARLAQAETPAELTVNPVEPGKMQQAGVAMQRARALTDSRELFAAGDAVEIFRLFQQVRFTPLRSPVDAELISDTDRQTLLDIAQTLRAMAEGLAASRNEELMMLSEAELVQGWLEAMSNESARTGERIPVALLANMRVPNFDDRTNTPTSTRITMTQLLLRKAVQIARAHHGDLINADINLQNKYDRLEAMTLPPHNKGRHSRKNAGAAFVYVFGNRTIGELAGEQVSLVDPDQTIQHLFEDYRFLDRASRQDWMSRARDLGWTDVQETDLPYSREVALEAGVTPYRSVIEAIEEAANFDITLDGDGNPVGKWADLSSSFSTTLRSVVTEIQNAVKLSPLTEQRAITPENIALFLEQNPLINSKLLDFIAPDPKMMVTMVKPVEIDGVTRLHIQPWVYEALARDPKSAELEIMMQSAILSWNARMINLRDESAAETHDPDDTRTEHQRDYHKLDDRLHQLFFKLSEGQARDLNWAYFMSEYETILNSGEGVDGFVRFLNKRHRGNQAPFTAWYRDVGTQDSNAILTFNQSVAGTKQRQALTELSSATKLVTQDIVAQKQRRDVDDHFISQARVQFEKGQEDGNELLSLRQLIEFNIDFEPSAGIAEIISQLVVSATGLYANNAEKAKSPEEFAALASQNIMLADYVSNYNIVNTSTGSVDIQTVLNNPRILLRGPIEITDRDGASIKWLDGIPELKTTDPQKFKKAMTDAILREIFAHWNGTTRGAANPRLSKGIAQSFFQKLLIPSVWQLNSDASGFNSRTLMPDSIAETAHGNLYNNLFGDSIAPLRDRSKRDLGVYGALVNGHTAKFGGDNDVIRFLNKYLQQRLASLTHMNETIAHEEVIRIAMETFYTLQKIGDHIANRIQPDGTLLQDEQDTDPRTGEVQRTSVLESLRRASRDQKLNDWVRKKFTIDGLEMSYQEAVLWIEAEMGKVSSDLIESVRTGDAKDLIDALQDPNNKADADRIWDDIQRHYQSQPEFEALQKLRFIQDVYLSREPVKALVNMYGYPPMATQSSSENAEARRKLIAGYVKTHGTTLRTRAPWAASSIDKVLAATRWVGENEDPGTSQAGVQDYKVTSRAIIAVEILRLQGHQGADEITVPVFPSIDKVTMESELPDDLKIWDPSQQYILDDMLSLNPMTRAAASISEHAGRINNPSRGELARILRNYLANEDRITDWNLFNVATQAEALVRLNASSAQFVVGMNGQPEDLTAFAAATPRNNNVSEVLKYGTAQDFMRPVKALHRNKGVIDLTLGLLTSGDPLRLRIVTVDAQGNTTEMPLANLQGRMVAPIMINGQQADMSKFALYHDAEDAWALDFNKFVAHYRRTKLPLNSVVEIQIVPQHAKIVEANGGATGLAHHSFFDGVIDITKDFLDTQSLIGERATIGEGALRRGQHSALKATRNGLVALRRADPFSYLARKSQEAGWETNLTEVLHRKARAVAIRGTNIESNPWQSYNADYKLQEIRHWVKGDGQLWSAARVIQWQQMNPGQSITEVLGENATLYVPSDQKLRAMLGDAGPQSNNLPTTRPWVGDPSLIPTFDGVDTSRAIREVPGLMQEGERDVFSTELASRRPNQRYYSTLSLTFNELLEKSRRMVVRQQRENEITNARIGLGNHFNPMDTSKLAVEIIENKLTNQDLAINWAAHNLPFNPRGEEIKEKFNKKAHAELIEATIRQGNKIATLFQHLPSNPNFDPSKGLLSDASFDDVPTGYQPGPGDIIVWDLDAYQDDGHFGDSYVKDFEKLRRTGATISLLAEGNRSRVSVAETKLMESAEYENVTGSTVWRPMEENNGKPRDTVALDSSLTSFEWVSRENKELILLSNDVSIDEGILVPKNLETYNDERVALLRNIIPTNPIKGFAPPNSVEALSAVRDVVAVLAQDDSPLSGRDRALMERLLEKYQNATEDAAIPLGELRQGDFIPVVRKRNGKYQVFFLRYGHRWEQNTELIRRGFEKNDGVYFITEGKIDEDFTSYEGIVTLAEGHDRWGTAVRIETTLGMLGEKFQLTFQGMKYMIGALTRDRLRLPTTPVTRTVDAIGISDKASSDSKQAFGGRLINHRTAAMMLGWDIRSRLLEGYRSLRNEPEASWDSMMEFFDATSRILPRIDPDDIYNGYKDLAEFRERFKIQGFENFDPADANHAFVEAALFYMMGARRRAITENPLESVVGPYGGLITSVPQANSAAPLMPSLFMAYFDNLSDQHPARQALVADWQRTLNSDENGYYILNSDFTVDAVIRRPDGGTITHRGLTLQVGEFMHEGHSPEFLRMAEQRKGDMERWSTHTAALANLIGGTTLTRSKDLTAVALEAIVGADVQNPTIPDPKFMEKLQDIGTSIPDYMMRWSTHNPVQELYWRNAHDMKRAFIVPLDENYWIQPDDRPGRQEERIRTINEAKMRIASKLNMTPEMHHMIDYWVRMVDGSWADRRPGSDLGQMSYDSVRIALEWIQQNVDNGLLPTADGQVPAMEVGWLQALYQANLNAPPGKRWLLRSVANDNLPLSEANTVAFDDWDGWVQVALGEMATGQREFSAVYLTAVDGFFHSYAIQENALTGLGVSIDALRDAELWDPELSRMVLSIDPRFNEIAKQPEIFDVDTIRLENLFGMERIQGNRWQGKRNVGDRSKRDRYMRQWAKKEGVTLPKPTTLRQIRRAGYELQSESKSRNSVVQVMLDLRHFTTLANPLLYGGAMVEMAMRNIQDNIVGTIMGTGQGALAAGFRGLTNERIAARNEEYVKTRNFLANNAEWIGELYRSLEFTDHSLRRNVITQFTGKLARVGNWFQDPTHSQSQHVMARRYIEAVLDYVNMDPGVDFTVEQVLYNLRRDPLWAAKRLRAAHDSASARVAQMRSLRKTALGMSISWIYDSLGNARNPILKNTSDIFLRIPLMYSTFMANIATNMLGLQVVNDFTLMFMNGRRKGLFGGIAAALRGDSFQSGTQEQFDFRDALDTIDLTRSAVSSGVSLSALAFGASVIGDLFGGEDEEERRRRLAMKYQTGSVLYDPRSLVNDWRNSEAIYLDAFPPLAALFGKTEGGQTPVLPHWIIKQFISPLIGIQKAMDTGNLEQIAWGFQEAVGSMPIWNETLAIDAHQTFETLMAQARETAKNEDGMDPEVAQMAAMGFLTRGIMAYESMILESSFANLVYQNLDKYDRDPFKIPDRLVDGTIVRNRADVPAPTTMLEEFFDPETGEIRKGYESRDYFQGTLYGYSENRMTLAFLLSLGTGFQDQTMWRQNMVPKTRTIQKEEMTIENAESLVMAAFNQTGFADDLTAVPTPTTDDASWVLSEFIDGHERLTDDGAEAVIKGLWMGTVSLESEALKGLYIPFEMRERLQTILLDKFMQEGVDIGLSQQDAERRAKLIWYGPYDDASVPGLSDIVWSDRIPYGRDMQYYQLNTTYITGPDGKPWATGLARNNFMAALGFPVQPYYTDATSPGLPTDERLNAFDPGANLNTGMRALEKVDDSWKIPTPEEIGKSIEDAIDKLADKIYTPSPRYAAYGGGGYRGGRYGGGGGGGGGRNPFMPFVNGMNTPYSDAIRDIYIQNVNVRRADIRRERFSSDRGRLKQWQ